MRILVIVGLACVVAEGCRTASQLPDGREPRETITVRNGEDFDLAAGQAASVTGTSITLLFKSVFQDSRCPAAVQCVWAGDGAIKLGLQSMTAASQVTSLHTTLDPKFIDYSGYRIRVVGLAPYPKSGSPIPAEKYVVTLHVSSP